MSVVDALGRALEITRDVCFRPFTPTRWLVLGVVAFLATCGESSGGSLPGGGGGGDEGSPGVGGFAEGAREALRWIGDNGALVGAVVGAGFVVVVALVALTTWVSSHGKLIFVDAIARGGDVNIGQAWRAHAGEAWSLFLLRLAIGLVFSLLLFLLVVPVAVPALRFVAGTPFQPGDLAVAIPALGAMGLVGLAAVVVGLLVDELLVPTMVLRRSPVRPAFEALRSAFGEELGAVTVYLVVRVLVGFFGGLLLAVLGLLTCCLGYLPIVGHVLFLPVYVYLRSLSLAWLAQRGAGWSVFPAPPGTPAFGEAPPDPD